MLNSEHCAICPAIGSKDVTRTTALTAHFLISYLSRKQVPQVGGRLSWSDNWFISILHWHFQESQNGALLRLDLVLILQVVRSI